MGDEKLIKILDLVLNDSATIAAKALIAILDTLVAFPIDIPWVVFTYGTTDAGPGIWRVRCREADEAIFAVSVAIVDVAWFPESL